MERDLRRLASEAFDLVVVGGGIHGAWIAWDAALRGLSVALVERGDFAGGASSNSLKIVHGGLRYLQSADLKRVRESIRERSVLLRVAPHLVRPLPFVIPLYGHGTRGPEALRVALALADLAGIDRNRGLDDDHLLPRGRVLSAAECLRYLPDIDRRGLRGGALWYDAQMRSDARIVLAVLRSAAERGAALANYLEAREVVVRDGRVAAVRVSDRLEGAEFEVRARVVALACGAWDRELLARAGAPAPPLLLSKAMNLAVPRLFGEWGAGVPLRGPGGSGRMLFATPWRDHTLIGTAHLPYHGPAEGFQPSWRDVEDLVADFNRAYPAARLAPGDVRRVYAGLLPADGFPAGREVALTSRHRVERLGARGGPRGLLAVMSVKFTTGRLAAQDAVDAAFAELGYRAPGCRTAGTPLAGAGGGGARPPVPPGLTVGIVDYLRRNYGAAWAEVLDLARDDPTLAEPVEPGSLVIRAEVVYAARVEMARRVDDVALRRTDLALAGEPSPEARRVVAELLGAALGWDRARVEAEAAPQGCGGPVVSAAG